MKHIYIISPSGAVLDKTGFRRGITQLKKWGCRVTIDEAALLRSQRFAGCDNTRLAALGRAAASGADFVLLGRGGYGLSRILDKLPITQIQSSIANGTKWLGYSDFTALQMALLASKPASIDSSITWAGPLVVADLGRKPLDEITEACFLDLLGGASEGTGWRLKPLEAKNLLASRAMQSKTFTGSIENAMLWGGNLCVLTSLLGTPYFPAPEVVGGGILFLEDVAEHPYRVERMLLQLYHAGLLATQKAILLGSFSRYQLSPLDKGYNLQTVGSYLRSLVDVPIITGLPFGHEETKVCLPVGAKVDLHLDGRDVFLLWGHEDSH